jgi:hypothetical protein
LEFGPNFAGSLIFYIFYIKNYIVEYKTINKKIKKSLGRIYPDWSKSVLDGTKIFETNNKKF